MHDAKKLVLQIAELAFDDGITSAGRLRESHTVARAHDEIALVRKLNSWIAPSIRILLHFGRKRSTRRPDLAPKRDVGDCKETLVFGRQKYISPLKMLFGERADLVANP
jgi:hypothetical protein